MAHNSDHVLGKNVAYTFQYNPEILAREPRLGNREIYGFTNETTPFAVGFDVWHAYECTFLTAKGLPVNGILKLVIPADSEYIVESKSLKLYLFSFNMQRLADSSDEAISLFLSTVKRDLSNLIGAEIQAGFFRSSSLFEEDSTLVSMDSLDRLVDLESITFDQFTESKEILQLAASLRPLTVKSDLLRSNCKITNQPDFGTVFISLAESQVDLESLAKYLVSFRGENHFHEEIVECIFARLAEVYTPDALMVTALYTRRGGIDICPVRASEKSLLPQQLIDPTILTVKEYRS